MIAHARHERGFKNKEGEKQLVFISWRGPTRPEDPSTTHFALVTKVRTTPLFTITLHPVPMTQLSSSTCRNVNVYQTLIGTNPGLKGVFKGRVYIVWWLTMQREFAMHKQVTKYWFNHSTDNSRTAYIYSFTPSPFVIR